MQTLGSYICVPQYILPSKTTKAMYDILYVCWIHHNEYKIKFRHLSMVKKKNGACLPLIFSTLYQFLYVFISTDIFYIYWMSPFVGLFVFCKAILIQNYDWNMYIAVTVICGSMAAYCQPFCLAWKADGRLFFPYQDLINATALICFF